MSIDIEKIRKSTIEAQNNKEINKKKTTLKKIQAIEEAIKKAAKNGDTYVWVNHSYAYDLDPIKNHFTELKFHVKFIGSYQDTLEISWEK